MQQHPQIPKGHFPGVIVHAITSQLQRTSTYCYLPLSRVFQRHKTRHMSRASARVLAVPLCSIESIEISRFISETCTETIHVRTSSVADFFYQQNRSVPQIRKSTIILSTRLTAHSHVPSFSAIPICNRFSPKQSISFMNGVTPVQHTTAMGDYMNTTRIFPVVFKATAFFAFCTIQVKCENQSTTIIVTKTKLSNCTAKTKTKRQVGLLSSQIIR